VVPEIALLFWLC